MNWLFVNYVQLLVKYHCYWKENLNNCLLLSHPFSIGARSWEVFPCCSALTSRPQTSSGASSHWRMDRSRIRVLHRHRTCYSAASFCRDVAAIPRSCPSCGRRRDVPSSLRGACSSSCRRCCRWVFCTRSSRRTGSRWSWRPQTPSCSRHICSFACDCAPRCAPVSMTSFSSSLLYLKSQLYDFF